MRSPSWVDARREINRLSTVHRLKRRRYTSKCFSSRGLCIRGRPYQSLINRHSLCQGYDIQYLNLESARQS